MHSALINFFKLAKKSNFVIILVFSLMSAFFVTHVNTSYAQVEGGARCRCANPEADGCACLVTEGGSVTRDFNGVSVVCDPEVADSFFNQANPVCGNNAEVVPYCSRSYRDDLLFCWGTSFAGPVSPGGIPLNSGGWLNVRDANDEPVTISFNGGSWGGITEIWTCDASLYCCGNNTCQEEGPAYGTCPSSGGPAPDSPASAACEGIASSVAGLGESRLWFSQTRLVSTLSTIAQTLFNPHSSGEYENDSYFEMYEDTAISKMATQAERDSEVYIGTWPFGKEYEPAGWIDNKGSITSRIERHQGIDDSTQAVNTTFNNSSVIVGVGAPPPLDPYYPEFKDRACFIEETFNNPGDDLIGAKERGEMLFTQQFTVSTKGRPVESSDYKLGGGACTGDGGSFSIPYEEQNSYTNSTCTYQGADVPCCAIDCCSTICSVNTWQNPCVELVEPANPLTGCSVQTGGSMPYGCPRQVDGEIVIYCCAEENLCIPPASVSVSCGTLPEVELPVGANANIYNKSPLLEYINNTILEGEDSIFRRFMPNLDGIFEIEQIPSKTLFGATASVINFGTAIPGSFQLKFADGQVASPEMYIPHLGSLYKYWLVDFQKALKPETFGTSDQPSPASNPNDPTTNPFENVACPTGDPPPDPTSSTGILCESNCRNISNFEVLSASANTGIDGQYFLEIKNNYIALAEAWVASGGQNSLAAECYNDVVLSSIEAGVNPIYSLAIWVQESGASNYDSNVTYCDPDDPSRTVQDFGINIPTIAGNFDAQLSYFLQLPYDYVQNYPQCFEDGCNIGNFSLIYWLGIPDDQCTFNNAALSYAEKTIRTMNRFSQACVPKYPTDLNCHKQKYYISCNPLFH